jgi:hypothetical protein
MREWTAFAEQRSSRADGVRVVDSCRAELIVSLSSRLL